MGDFLLNIFFYMIESQLLFICLTVFIQSSQLKCIAGSEKTRQTFKKEIQDLSLRLIKVLCCTSSDNVTYVFSQLNFLAAVCQGKVNQPHLRPSSAYRQKDVEYHKNTYQFHLCET